MKTYTDGNILVQAESMTDVEYFVSMMATQG